MIIHFIPNALAAIRFVEPLTVGLSYEGTDVEIWIEKSASGSLSKKLSCPVRWYTFSLSSNLLGMLFGFVRLWVTLSKLRPAAIEAHFSRGALIPLLAAKLAGVSIRIYHNHGAPYLGYRGFLRFLLKWLERLNIMLASHVVTVSPGIRQAYARDGLLKASDCMVFGPGSACGLNLSEYVFSSSDKDDGKERLGLGSCFVVMYVGRPLKRKGFHLILSAWVQNFRDFPDMRLLLAGVTNQEVEHVLGSIMPVNMEALGFVEDLRPYYAASDVIVLPSEHEGFGYALLEGAASGCCLIASDIPGPDAILSHGVNGFAIKAGDLQGLTASIFELQKNPQTLRFMSVAARQSAEPFDRKLIVSSYIKYINDRLAMQDGNMSK